MLISWTLIDSYISYYELVLVNVLEENDHAKTETKNSNTHEFLKDFNMFIKHCYLIAGCVEKKKNVKTQKMQERKMENKAFIKMCAV